MPLLALCAVDLPEPNPWRWTAQQACLAALIIQESDANNLDPHSVLAIAWTESNLRPTATRRDDHGMMQINYRFWHDALGYTDRRAFASAMAKPERNLAAAIHVINTYRTNHKKCRGDGIFRCYNGGPYWNQKRGAESKSDYRSRRSRVDAYHRRLVSVRRRLHLHYGTWIGVQRIREGVCAEPATIP